MWSHAGVQGQVFWFTELFIKADQYWNLFCCHSCSSLCHFRRNPTVATGISLSLFLFLILSSFPSCLPPICLSHPPIFSLFIILSVTSFHLILFYLSFLGIKSLPYSFTHQFLLSVYNYHSFVDFFFFFPQLLSKICCLFLTSSPLHGSEVQYAKCFTEFQIPLVLLFTFIFILFVYVSFFLTGSVQLSKRASVRNLFASSHMLLKQVCIKLQHYAKKTKQTENPVYSARTVHMAASSIPNHREEAHRHMLQNKYLLIWTYG